MNELLTRGDYVSMPVDYRLVLLSLLLAFACGHVVAWVYMAAHTGLSYSRSFVNSLIVMPVLVALVLMVLSNNLVTAFGLMAVLAIVRFRNVLRDTLDTTYVLSVIVLGMAAGTQRYTTTIMGCAVVVAILGYLSISAFGTRHRYDVIVNLHWARAVAELPDLAALLQRHSRRTVCANQRVQEGRDGVDLSYRILLRDPDRTADLLGELRNLPGVSRVTSLAAGDESEM